MVLPSLLATGNARGQATSASADRKADLQVGGYYVFVSPDYTPPHFPGFGGYVTYDFKPHWGVEANIRQANTTASDKVSERTYEIGARYVLRRGPFNPYVRVSCGRGVFNFPYNVANLAYNLYSFGGGLDYNLVPSINIRGDYEYQSWMNFPPHGLKPQAISIGIAYHFH